VLLARREPDDVARANFLDPAALALQPQPNVTSSVWPSQAVRAPGSKETVAPPTRAGAFPLNGASIRTVPVKYSAGPFADGCDPLRLISIVGFPSCYRYNRCRLAGEV
jgi:hypothetical protein